ncbi:protein HEXIM1-like [Haliotis cracherodii]|uniref:protein HEXIM1-like n=1 Tax=Haliotis rufescens TaxID=6454 RepID=UPI001EB0AD37|nr:protein HEXIM1-like [Haliotis rufescens]
MMEVEFSTVDVESKKICCENSTVVKMSKDDEDVLSGTSDGDVENKQPEGGSESDNQQNSLGQRKKPRRRGRHKGGKHHRKWKPYNKLTWSERKELEERETIRATMKREEAFASGHPVAPYNTTQFLIDDHIQSEVSLDLIGKENDVNGVGLGRNGKDGSFGSGESSEEPCGSGDEDDMFLAKEFSETYDNIHAERLQMMSKEELIKDYLDMERKVERLERLAKDIDQHNPKGVNRDGSTGDRDSSDGQSLSSSGEEPIDLVSVKKIEEEIKNLKDENSHLKAEIGRLKKI